MECALGGELKEYLHKRGKFDEEDARNIFMQIADAIKHCHKMNVIHRDLKLENVLFANKGCRYIKVCII
jgi:serine/threonine protein kinase